MGIEFRNTQFVNLFGDPDRPIYGNEVVVPASPSPTPSITPTLTPSNTPSPTPSITPSITPTPSVIPYEPMTMEIDTTLWGQLPNNDFSINTTGTFNVDWGDGSSLENYTSHSGNISHIYTTPGIYEVKFYTNITNGKLKIQTNFDAYARKITELIKWGQITWDGTDFISAFAGAANMVITATDLYNIDTSGIVFYENAFRDCNVLTWNSDVANLDVSSAIGLANMFYAASSFNQDISGWNTSQVQNFSGMFVVSNFNQNISSWDTSNGTGFGIMFLNNTHFNQPIGAWDTSSAQDMSYMLYGATSFNQDLSNWNVSGITNFSEFMFGCNLSPSNYDAILNSWSKQSVQTGITINFGSSNYTSAGEVARDILINTYGWTITDGGII